MLRVRLIHWNVAEAARRADRLRSFGYEVEFDFLQGPEGLKQLRNNPPAAVVIDLGRIPSQGRDVGIALRSYKDTRVVPIVFVGGDPAKLERIKELLPDAAYSDWGKIRRVLEKAISRPSVRPVVPPSRMAAYAGAPLPKKLGIKPGTTVFLVEAPPGFETKLGGLPQDVKLKRGIWRDQAGGPGRSREKDEKRRLILWFVRSERDLELNIKRMADLTPAGGMWIIWPKKAAGVSSDLTQNIVRAQGLAAGIVDYKICAVDETWSGLLFARRR